MQEKNLQFQNTMSNLPEISPKAFFRYCFKNLFTNHYVYFVKIIANKSQFPPPPPPLELENAVSANICKIFFNSINFN